MAVEFASQVTLPPGQFPKRRSQVHTAVAGAGSLFFQQVHYRCRQHVHAEETKIMAGAQARNDEPLLRFGGGGLLQHLRDLIHPLSSGHQMAAHRAVIGQLALVGSLHRRDGTILGHGELNQLLRWPFLVAADIKMIAYQKQKRLSADKITPAKHRMAVTKRSTLLDKSEAAPLPARRSGIGGLISWTDHDANLFDSRREDFLNDNPQRGLGRAVAVNQRLERKRPLVLACGRDDGFLDFHRLQPFDLDVPEGDRIAVAGKTKIALSALHAWMVVIGHKLFDGCQVAVEDHRSVELHFDLGAFDANFFKIPL